MSTSEDLTYFTALSEPECRDLLRHQEVGRVAWHSATGINVFPVNYQVHDDAVVFHTASGSTLSALTQETQVAFQIDDIDTEAAVGWTVLAHGRSGPAEGFTPASWAPNTKVGISVVIEHLTGRVISGATTKESQ